MSISSESADSEQVGGDEIHAGNIGPGAAVALGRGARAEVRNFITNIFNPADAEQQRAERNRRAMLELVRTTWVKGVLEKSLDYELHLELGLVEHPSAVAHPWDMVVQESEQSRRLLPPGSTILAIFGEMNQALLILGEPGSGKTTMLLELARETIARAEQDAKQPIPVVFNLSSWAGSKQSIAEWLAEELNAKYYVPKPIAHSWLEHDELLLLLDGLDEVKAENRVACLEALNTFRGEHGLAALAVCSRVGDYESLSIRLQLQGAVLIQPLTPQQIEQYLARTSGGLEGFRQALQQDPVLQDLARSPLMLNIMALAYRGVSANALQPQRSLETSRQQLLDAYVQRMFKRRGADARYSPAQTLHWLAWLARQMSAHQQSIFYLARMQHDWFSTAMQQRVHVALCVFIVSLSFWLPLLGLGEWLAGGPLVGIALGLVLGWGLGRSDEFQTLGDLITWSWKDARKVVPWGLLLGLAMALAGTLLYAQLGWVSWLVMGLGFGLYGGLGAGLNIRSVETTASPNQDIQQSVKNALVIGLAVAPLGALAGAFGGGQTGGLFVIGGWVGALGAGLLIGLFFGWVVGGAAVLSHYMLRLVLYLNGAVPWNYVRFLDYAAERIFLRKVGGGYIFVHRLLMEYFASLGLEKS